MFQSFYIFIMLRRSLIIFLCFCTTICFSQNNTIESDGNTIIQKNYSEEITSRTVESEKISQQSFSRNAFGIKLNIGYTAANSKTAERHPRGEDYILNQGIAIKMGLAPSFMIKPNLYLLYGFDIDVFILWSIQNHSYYIREEVPSGYTVQGKQAYHVESTRYLRDRSAWGVHWQFALPIEVKFYPISDFWVKSGFDIAFFQGFGTKIKEEDRWDLPLTDCAFDFVPNFVFGLGHSQKIAGIPIFDYGITFSYSLAYYKYHRDEYIPDTKYFRIAFDFIYKI